MKIIKTKDNKANFGNLTLGTVFYAFDTLEYCIKIEEIKNEYGECSNAVSLEEGTTRFFDDTDVCAIGESELAVYF